MNLQYYLAHWPTLCTLPYAFFTCICNFIFVVLEVMGYIVDPQIMQGLETLTSLKIHMELLPSQKLSS